MEYDSFLSIEFLMFLVALLSAIYSYRSSREAKKANDMSNLNALLSLRAHYKEKMEINYANARANISVGDKPTNLSIKFEIKGSEFEEKLAQINEKLERYYPQILEYEI